MVKKNNKRFLVYDTDRGDYVAVYTCRSPEEAVERYANSYSVETDDDFEVFVVPVSKMTRFVSGKAVVAPQPKSKRTVRRAK